MSARESLPNRRGSLSFNFLHDGHTYHATATRYTDGRLAEIFLDVGLAGSSIQQHATSSAVLASIALQHGVAPQTLIHAVRGGPLAAALELAVKP
jgi:ribonucleoside-diphosphate reductase alpha chain